MAFYCVVELIENSGNVRHAHMPETEYDAQTGSIRHWQVDAYRCQVFKGPIGYFPGDGWAVVPSAVPHAH